MKNFKIYIYIVIALLIASFVFSYFNNRNARIRYESNQTNLLKELQGLKTDLVQLEFNNQEMQDFIKSNDTNQNSLLKGINKKLADNDIKLKRINRLMVTNINAVDSTFNKIILDSLSVILARMSGADSTRLAIPFEDKTKCFEFRAQIVFENGEVAVEVLERKYNDTLYNVSYWERNKWNVLGLFKTRFLGRKVAQVKIFNNCGFSKTIVIDNRKQKVKG